MKIKKLVDWLAWISIIHDQEVELGLDRIQKVANKLATSTLNCPILTIAGTNGKGSCVALAESIYLEAGYKVGAFTSPILHRHNDYVRVQGKPVEDEFFCDAFQKVESARDNVPLTFFEFNTLAAFEIFKTMDLDIWILEVGLGGRLDAVNVLDPDIAVVTTIALDHTDRLGSTREEIGWEKAGIFRNNRPAVCGDFNPPQSLILHANLLKVPLYRQGVQFHFRELNDHWEWISQKNYFRNLPIPSLSLQNMSTTLMAVELLQEKIIVSEKFVKKGLEKVHLPGRLQTIQGDVIQVFDVSHNPAATELLARHLKKLNIIGKTYAIFSMLKDKDIYQTLLSIKDNIDEWHIAPLDVSRGATQEELKNHFEKVPLTFFSYESIGKAYEKVLQFVTKGDAVIVFGSFHTVSAVIMRNARE